MRKIGPQGWQTAELITLGSLTRNWATAFTSAGHAEKIWELPMIELHPVPSL
ncbi:hypothetical protein SH580_18865 [Coraliomargarita algicola]|uniref:Uncharacterized protein n=1 Tax=Coraliomargarita algicola TaxID=3092156 RepID=A0ABZ0RJQ1_9BACT|nr:hypothetical protein [Coraliomargarita sp. J2-16]WPJ95484.1 hypothetical protein SH580_18865 [Coraliomargarita sp. J2-16]